MHGACVGPGLHQRMQWCELLLFVTTEDGKYPYIFFNHFLSTLVYVEVVYVCLQIETIVGFLHLRFFCLHLLFFFFCKCAYSPEFTYSLLLIWQLELELVDVLCNLFKIPYLSY